MIYTPFSNFTIGFVCLRIFADFDLESPKYVSRMKILRTYGLKKVAKEAKVHLTQTYHGQCHSLCASRRKQQGKTNGTNKPVGPQLGRGGNHGPW